jgi:hypothetical protein
MRAKSKGLGTEPSPHQSQSGLPLLSEASSNNSNYEMPRNADVSAGTQKVSVLRALRPQRGAMKSDHMRVHAFDVDKVTTDLAGNVAGRVGNRLLN